jgi:hypothetical protein
MPAGLDGSAHGAAASWLPKIDRWRTLLAYICRSIVGRIELPTPPLLAAPE